jgi:hypothetical protein
MTLKPGQRPWPADPFDTQWDYRWHPPRPYIYRNEFGPIFTPDGKTYTPLTALREAAAAKKRKRK